MQRLLWVAPLAGALVCCGGEESPVESTTQASHSWANYHWFRTSNPFTLSLGDNVSGNWDQHLIDVSSDWSVSSVVDTVIVPGNGSRSCKATAGTIQVCNRKWGFNGWLGLAQIWLSGGHIVQAVAKMNDSYLQYYDSVAKRHVMCQEIGHDFGLDHQYAASCMNDLDGLSDPSYQSPNQHDYEELETIYSHLDGTSSSPTSSLAAQGVSAGFGAPVAGRGDLFFQDLGGGVGILTWVTWAR